MWLIWILLWRGHIEVIGHSDQLRCCRFEAGSVVAGDGAGNHQGQLLGQLERAEDGRGLDVRRSRRANGVGLPKRFASSCWDRTRRGRTDFDTCNLAQRRLVEASESGLYIGERGTLGLQLFDRADFEQVALVIKRGSTAHLGRPADEAEGRVVANRPFAGDGADLTVIGTLVPGVEQGALDLVLKFRKLPNSP